ncbi:MAG: hypothetical protein M1323_04840 [Candidatus Thermoplasmatota archaeon]|jgi:hypothetical protein|nr:hypothetical protein [Candidatus Thermoplasmatota archaeon]OWP54301.1 MAG: hypothetical protein B2I18_03200 [Cuniculiplasma sp. C_DKE]
MAIKLRKSEDDKQFETRSKIRNYKSQIDRGLKRQQQLMAQAINNIKKAASIKDKKGMLNAAQNAVRIKSSIEYLKSFSLYLDNLEITFEFVYNERRNNEILSDANKELNKRMLSEEQARQIENNIQAINQKTEDLERRLEDQFGNINQSLDEFAARGGENVDEVIGSIVGQNTPENQEKSNSEIDDLISKIMGENTKT